jgi:hypothetical protein
MAWYRSPWQCTKTIGKAHHDALSRGECCECSREHCISMGLPRNRQHMPSLALKFDERSTWLLLDSLDQ